MKAARLKAAQLGAARLAIGSYRGSRGRDLAAPRRRRRSRRQSLLRSLAVLLTLALLTGGGYWLLTSPVFAVARVESGPFRFSTKAAVDEAFGRVLGHNIWTLRRGDLAAACAGLPWVREVHLRRRLPDELMVQLIEWRPLLEVAAPAGTGEDAGAEVRLLVADGRVLAVPAHLDVPGLPVLVGCAAPPGEDGVPRLAEAELTPLLDLVRAVQESGLEAVAPVDFIRRTPEGFVLELQAGIASLQLGHEDFARRLGRYLLAPERVPPGHSVDLRFEQRITIDRTDPDRT